MNPPLRIGLAGLGTVGGGTLKILREHAPMLAERCGRALEITAVCARDRDKKRSADTQGLRWVDDPMALASDAQIDVIVETIGGSEGQARALVEAALTNGKSVVTANKALIAHHGIGLAALAEKSGAVLAFEAAVAGGIPIIKAMRDGLAANRFVRIAGILNGTCNYILTDMWVRKRGFDEVLAEAQALGYAEVEPSFDVDGIDTAHKTAILASLAYGIAPAIDKVHVEGIRAITLRDMEFADELGYVIKLLGIAALTEHGLEQRVHPCLVEKSSQLASVHGVYNAILAQGDAVGTVLFEGRGAGAGPTASSIVADLMDIARGALYKPFTLPVSALKIPSFADMAQLHCSYYLRLGVVDRPGVLAEITNIFKAENISLRAVVQHSHKPGEVVQLVLTTHETQEAAMVSAMRAIERSHSVREKPFMIRIEAL
jgi:homoserine dehydrogenase